MPLIKTDPDNHTAVLAAPWIDVGMLRWWKCKATEQTNARSILGLGDAANFRRLVDTRRDRAGSCHWLNAALTATSSQPHLNAFSLMGSK